MDTSLIYYSILYFLLAITILYFLFRIMKKTPAKFKQAKNSLELMYNVSILFSVVAIAGGFLVLIKHRGFGFWILSFTSIPFLTMLMLYVFKKDIKDDKLFYVFISCFCLAMYVVMFLSLVTWIDHPAIKEL